MGRRVFSREFKLEAVKLVRERGVAVAQACRDLDIAESVLRRWMRETAAEQRLAEFTGAKSRYTGGTPETINSNSSAVERESYDFYRTSRGAHPNTTTQPALSSNVAFMNFYPVAQIETISLRPMLLIAGDKAHSLEFSQDAYARAAEPKELFLVPGAGHVDLYDRVSLIPFDKLAEFFRANLS